MIVKLGRVDVMTAVKLKTKKIDGDAIIKVKKPLLAVAFEGVIFKG